MSDRPGRRFRFTLAQLVLVVTLCALALGLVRTVWQRATRSVKPEALAFSPDGWLLAGGFDDGTVKIWDLASGEPLASWSAVEARKVLARGGIRHMAFSGNDRLVALTNGGEVGVWHVAGGRSVSTFSVPGAPLPAALSDDGELVASQSMWGKPSQVLDVATQQAVATLPFPKRASMVAYWLLFSPDGETLAVQYPGGLVEFWDVATAKSLGSLKLGADVSLGAISPDGERLASTGGGLSEQPITIWNLKGREPELTLGDSPCGLGTISFSPDGKTLAAGENWGRLGLWDVAAGQLRATLERGTSTMALAYAPDRRTLATASYTSGPLVGSRTAINLWNTATHEKQSVLWKRDTRPATVLLGFGFAVWLLLWAHVRDRQKRSRRREAVQPSKPLPEGPETPIGAFSVNRNPPCFFVKGSKQKIGCLRLTALMLLLVILAFLLTPNIEAHFPRHPWIAAPLAIITAAVVVSAIMFLVTFAWMLVHVFLPHSHYWDLAGARNRTGAEGVLLKSKWVTAWFSGACRLESTLIEQLESARNRFGALVGEEVGFDRPLLILCFQEESAFLALLRNRSLLPGVCHLWPKRKITMCEDAARDRLSDPAEVLHVLLACYFLHKHKGFQLPPWLQMGIGALVALPGEREDVAARNRRIKLWLATERILTGDELLRTTGRELWPKFRNRVEHTNFDYVARFADQSWSLLDYLCGGDAPDDRRGRFRSFLADLKRGDDCQDVFRRHFGYGLEQLIEHWRDWALRQNAEHAWPPRPEIQDALLERLIPLIRDADAPAERRVVAIRSMGAEGNLLGADALVDLLRGREADLGKEVIWALEAISGQALGDDVAGWHAWWQDTAGKQVARRAAE